MDWSYIAGYFDGEGHVGNHPNGKYRISSLVWYNTHRLSLEAIRDFMGFGTVYLVQKRPGRRQGYYLKIGRKIDLLSAIDGMLPFLIVKRDAAVLLREHLRLHVDETRSENYGKAASLSVEQLKNWYEVGKLSVPEIAKKIGVHSTAISTALRRHGISIRPRNAGHLKGRPKSEATKEKMRATQLKKWENPTFRAAQIAAMALGKSKGGYQKNAAGA